MIWKIEIPSLTLSGFLIKQITQLSQLSERILPYSDSHLINKIALLHQVLHLFCALALLLFILAYQLALNGILFMSR